MFGVEWTAIQRRYKYGMMVMTCEGNSARIVYSVPLSLSVVFLSVGIEKDTRGFVREGR